MASFKTWPEDSDVDTLPMFSSINHNIIEYNNNKVFKNNPNVSQMNCMNDGNRYSIFAYDSNGARVTSPILINSDNTDVGALSSNMADSTSIVTNPILIRKDDNSDGTISYKLLEKDGTVPGDSSDTGDTGYSTTYGLSGSILRPTATPDKNGLIETFKEEAQNFWEYPDCSSHVSTTSCDSDKRCAWDTTGGTCIHVKDYCKNIYPDNPTTCNNNPKCGWSLAGTDPLFSNIAISSGQPITIPSNENINIGEIPELIRILANIHSLRIGQELTRYSGKQRCSLIELDPPVKDTYPSVTSFSGTINEDHNYIKFNWCLS